MQQVTERYIAEDKGNKEGGEENVKLLIITTILTQKRNKTYLEEWLN